MIEGPTRRGQRDVKNLDRIALLAEGPTQDIDPRVQKPGNANAAHTKQQRGEV